MGFQDFKLPPSLVTEMYRKVLVEEPGGLHEDMVDQVAKQDKTEQARPAEQKASPDPVSKPRQAGSNPIPDASAKTVPDAPANPIPDKLTTTDDAASKSSQAPTASEVLLTSPSAPAAKSSSAADAPPFLGGNLKQITLLAKGKKALNASAPETQFLLKILLACGLGMNDIALIDLAQVRMGLQELIILQKPQKILLFSAEINTDRIAPELCFLVEKFNDTQVLYAPPVHELMKDSADAVQLKKRLWAVLKNFFNV